MRLSERAVALAAGLVRCPKGIGARFFVAIMLAVAGCSSAEPPHSDYFLVFFEPTDAGLLPEGKAALARAVHEAGRGNPREIAIKGYVRADGNERDLSEQRMQVVEQTLIAGGLSGKIMRRTPETVDPQAFGRLGNGVVVQIERGAAPKPTAGDAASE
jgi:hypothetical protein